MRHRTKILERSKAIVDKGLAALTRFCTVHSERFSFHPPQAGPVAYIGIRGDGLTAADAQAYSETLVRPSTYLKLNGAFNLT